MFYFTLREITRYSITFYIALHHTHVQVRLMNSSHVIQTCLQRGVIKLVTHTHGEIGATRILKDFITLIPMVNYRPTHGKTYSSKMQDVSKVGSRYLSWICCLRKFDEFRQLIMWNWTKQAFWMWLDTSNHHNLTIPFDDTRFDAVEETVAAAPAALKTPMLVTSAQGDLL